MKKLVIFVSVGIVGLFLLPTSCDHHTIDELEVQSYLFLEGGDGLSLQDQQMLRKAFVRAGVGLQDGKFHFKARSGKELNMSEQLFEMLKGMVDYSNNRRLSMNFQDNPPRLKSGVENPTSPADTIASDCVSYVISEVLSNFGSFFPRQDVNDWIIQQYGYQGVPGNVLYDVLDNYLVGNQISIPTAYDALSSANQMVATVRLGNNIGHAVIILNIDDDNVMVRDPQKADLEPSPTNPHGWYLYSKSEIVHLYEASASN